MRLLRFIPIKLTFALISGIILGKFSNPSPETAFIAVLLSFMMLGYVFLRQQSKPAFKIHTSSIFGAMVLLTTLCIGIMAVSLSNPRNHPSHYGHLDFEGKHLWQFKIEEVLKTTPFSERYIATVEQMGKQSAKGKVLVTASIGTISEKLMEDDELIANGQLVAIRGPLNPHQFDYKKYLEGLGVTHQFLLGKTNYVLNDKPRRTLFGLAAQLRTMIVTKLKALHFGTEELAIIQALLLGQRNDISPETYDAYKNAGAVHILALSGLHIGILLVLLQYLLIPLERLPKGRIIKLYTIVALLWSFALLAGFSASIVRAVAMFSFVAYSLSLNRPNNTYNILALSIIFILLVIDPLLLFQVGFQMSYAAVFAIVWGYPLLERMWNPRNKVLRYLWRLLCVSITAQLGVLPISLFYFHQFPGLFFISNLVIIPFLGILLCLGIVVILLAVLNLLPNTIVSLYDTLIRWMNTVVKWVADQESFIFSAISFDTVQLVMAYSLVIALLIFLSRPNYRSAAVGLLSLIALQSWSAFTHLKVQEKEVLLLAHQIKNSILIHQNGSYLNVKTKNITQSRRIILDYSIAERTPHIEYDTLRNSYKWHNKHILIVDSLEVTTEAVGDLDYLILTQSPKSI